MTWLESFGFAAVWVIVMAMVVVFIKPLGAVPILLVLVGTLGALIHWTANGCGAP